jgi:chromosome partitioning protein
MQKIVILNPKGGSGKTTIATNLASYFATCGLKPTLMDVDAQGSSTRWLNKRAKGQPHIHGIAAYERNSRVTRSFATRLPMDTERLVVDTAAALEPQSLPDMTRNATAVLVPVLPSDIDIHAAAKCISNLLLIAKIRREEQRIAVIANRVKKNTLVYKALMKFLETLNIPVVATLRDSQNYIRAAESGQGLFEMKPTQVREDMEQWLPLIGWLAQRRPLYIAPGTPAITSGNSVSSLNIATHMPASFASRAVNPGVVNAASGDLEVVASAAVRLAVPNPPLAARAGVANAGAGEPVAATSATSSGEADQSPVPPAPPAIG